MTDPHIRAVELALARYSLARVPTAERTHAFLVAAMELVSQRTGLVVTMRVGEGVILRGANE